MTDEVKNIFKGFRLLVLLVLVFLIGTLFIGFNTDLDGGGACFSVVFDKAAVMTADKIVVRDGGQVITITDKALVREIASEFVVANRTDLCGYYDDRWMEIYNGDTLVRNIHWNDHDDLAEVYSADLFHWIFPSTSKVGQVDLSREFVDRLEEILQSQ